MSELPADKVYLGAAASGYDEGRLGNPVTDEDDAAIKRFLSEFASGSLIGDAPCGTGRALKHVLDAGLKYFGADISPDMLEICRGKVPPGQEVRLDLADARSLPWDSASCDGLLSIKFLKWLPSDKVVLDVLKEYRRVCKGRAFVNVKLSDQVQRFSIAELVDRGRKVIDRLTLGTSARYMTRKNFEALVGSAGWKIVRIDSNLASNNIVFNYILE